MSEDACDLRLSEVVRKSGCGVLSQKLSDSRRCPMRKEGVRESVYQERVSEYFESDIETDELRHEEATRADIERAAVGREDRSGDRSVDLDLTVGHPFHGAPDLPIQSFECLFSKLAHSFRAMFWSAAANEVPVYGRFLVNLWDDFTEEFSSWASSGVPEAEAFKRQLIAHMVPELEMDSGYYWGLRSCSLSRVRDWEYFVTFRCASQQDRISGSTPAGSTVVRIAEKRHKIERFQCQEEMQAKGFEIIVYEDNHTFQAIVFTTPFWMHVDAMKEIVTDSTFKTDTMRFEFFGIIANLGEFGVPLASMLYLEKTDTAVPSQGQPRMSRKVVLARWYKGLYDRGLRPVFLLTDKDLGRTRILSADLRTTLS
ncbi:hypothetical protein R1sor_019903 [Riccia sorocarpa]|uniref:Uncharacterized protein n=1 Tax=Riccia sorocarpa TaxID=122646 RepID=A0ABD3IEY8_9MARC